MKRLVEFLFAASITVAASAQGLRSNPVIDGWYADPEGFVEGKIAPVEMRGSWIPEQAKERAAQLVSKMTLEEKCTLIHGVKGDGEYEDGFHIM
ncbi:MAG: hypothetical protein K6A64_09280, partial [Bacteroidales bacterium]|nr:hypothetical protein [Bacteroidales bacterium]